MVSSDIRYALRTMRRAPLFTAVAVTTLAVGIGANAAIFSVADALVLKPLPVERPAELRALFQVLRIGGRALKSGSLMPYSLYANLREHGDVFSGTTAFAELDELAIETGERRQIRPNGAAFVADNYFTVLGVTPRLGRGFRTGEDAPAAPERVVLLSDRFWRREFDARRDVLGETIRIAGNPFTIIGVTPPEFFGLVLGRSPDVYLPLGTYAVVQPGIVSAENHQFWMVRTVGRLARTVSDQTAAARLTTVLQASFAADPKPVIELQPIDTGFSDVRTRFLQPAQVLMLLAGVLLLIACTNVALMLLARNVARRSEIAIRIAIGAGRRRVLQQFVTEGLVFAIPAVAIGLAAAPWAARALVPLLPGGTAPMSLHVAIDARVLIFTAGISLAAVLLFATLPAIKVVALGASASLVQRRGTTPVYGGLGGSLVVAEIAMSLIVLAGAGLLTGTLHRLSTSDPGYETDRVTLLDVAPADRGYADERRSTYYLTLLERLTAIPGVQSVSMSHIGLLDRDSRTTGTIDVPGTAPLSDDERMAQVYFVGPRFFETLGIPLRSGRDFTAADMSGPRVAALNETAARRFFDGANPVGSTINNGLRVLAVVGDSRYHELREPAVPAMFLPYTQARLRERMIVSVRAATSVSPEILRAAQVIDPLVPMRVTPLREIKERSLSQERLLAMLSGFFAVTALLLLVIGLFGLVTFGVKQRRTEIGVRVALGATANQVVWLILQRPLKLAAFGILIGLPATLAVTRLMQSLLFGLTPGDLPTLAAATIVVILLVAASAAWPSWRASRVDPANALRTD